MEQHVGSPAVVSETVKHDESEVVSSSCESLALTSDPPSDRGSVECDSSDLEEELSEINCVGCKNQRDEDGGSGDQRDAVSSCSSLSVEASEGRPVGTDDASEECESLSLSGVSTESDSAETKKLVLCSSESAQSECNYATQHEDGDGQEATNEPVTLQDQAENEQPDKDVESLPPSSLSGEWSSSSFEVQYMDDSERDEATQVDASADDELWRDFEAALENHESCAEATIQPNSSQHCVTPFQEDDGYDGSASEEASASSQDDSVDDMDDHYSYSGIRADHVTEIDSPDERGNEQHAIASSLSDGASSSLSSVASTNSRAIDSPVADLHVDALSISGEEDQSNHRSIENLPVLRQDASERDLINTGSVECPKHWRIREYVDAAERQHKRRWSDESLTLVGEDPHSLSDETPLTTLAATKKPVSAQWDHLEARETYVSFAELAGMIERHVTRRPGLFVDLGCGTSRVCEELVFHGYTRVLGVDKDLSAIAFQRHQSAAMQLPESLQFLPVDAVTSLILPDGCCDLILGKATLDEIAAGCLRMEFPQELIEALNESIRCLKPGGVLMAIVYQEGMFDENGVEFQSGVEVTPDERAAARLLTPWWRWAEIRDLMDRQLTLTHQYDLGQPCLIDGVRSKPYKALVWRRRESGTERLRRLAGDLMDAKQQQREYETRLWQCHAEQEWAKEELHIIRESRQMVLEDERGRLTRAFASEAETVRLRQQYREAFYAALLEDDRDQMVREDRAARQQHEEEQERRAFIVETVLCELIISKAIDLVIARQQRNTAMLVYQEVKVMATGTDKTASNDEWVRDEVEGILSGAITSVVRGAPEHEERSENPARAPGTGHNHYATPLAGGESYSISDPANAAADAVDWILSSAIASFTSRETSSRPGVIRTAVDPPHEKKLAAAESTDIAHEKTEAEAERPLPATSLAPVSHENAPSPSTETPPTHASAADTIAPTNIVYNTEQTTRVEAVESSDEGVAEACREAIEFILHELVADDVLN